MTDGALQEPKKRAQSFAFHKPIQRAESGDEIEMSARQQGPEMLELPGEVMVFLGILDLMMQRHGPFA